MVRSGPCTLFPELGRILLEYINSEWGRGAPRRKVGISEWGGGTWVCEPCTATEPVLRAPCRGGEDTCWLSRPSVGLGRGNGEQQAASLPESTEESARTELEIGKEMNLIRPKQAICLQEVTFRFPWKSLRLSGFTKCQGGG